jgi:senataxin
MVLNNATNSLGNLLNKLDTSLVDDSIKGLEGQLLNNASVIFSTLSVAGRKLMKEMNSVDVLIVDEASQALEAEIFIPLVTCPQRFLLIGDINQLPATVISEKAKELNFDRSLMSRLVSDCKQGYLLLDTQYRMHKEISMWPSKHYYENKLKDGITRDWLLEGSPSIFEPYAFININAKEQMCNHSFANEQEAYYISKILQHLQTKKIDITKQVGVITFYSAQVAQIKNQLKKINLPNENVHTVDGFQGEECDIIIISFVRSNLHGTIGFLNDYRRLNVALTRAKFSLIMLGNAATFEKKESDISKLIIDARKRNLFFEESNLKQILKPLQNQNKQITSSKNKSSQSAPISPFIIHPYTPSVYKTELCRFFQQGRSCKNGNECNFAHGEHELRSKR